MYMLYNRFDADYQEECLQRGLPTQPLIDKLIADFSGADFKFIFLGLVFFMISNVARALRWKQMLEPLGYKPSFINSIGSIMVAYLVNLGIPRSGEFVRAGLLSQYEDYQPEKVMGTIVTDRIVDVLCLLIMIGLGILTSYATVGRYLEEHLDLSQKLGFLTAQPLLLAVAALVGVAVLALAWRQREAIGQSKIGAKVINLLQGLWEGVKSIRKLRQPGLFVFYSIVIWAMYYLMTYICMFAFEPTQHLSPAAGLAVFVMGAIGIVFPSPGGMGAYHYMIAQGLMMYGLTEADGFSFGNIVFFSLTIFCNVLFGVLAWILLPWFNKKAEHAG